MSDTSIWNKELGCGSRGCIRHMFHVEGEAKRWKGRKQGKKVSFIFVFH